ncbi:uncharacterized protein RSE6_04810 [Rhynchosporium secalis]|uniref:Uncharacterized protein n=1 Tax=Rhynchosporium secalis TaxID=38038 RepID=A0A1E1M683_RHYSE|nr:uncharacterized protein RSE6_04810 [Rhynchosporium secalis]
MRTVPETLHCQAKATNDVTTLLYHLPPYKYLSNTFLIQNIHGSSALIDSTTSFTSIGINYPTHHPPTLFTQRTPLHFPKRNQRVVSSPTRMYIYQKLPQALPLPIQARQTKSPEGSHRSLVLAFWSRWSPQSEIRKVDPGSTSTTRVHPDTSSTPQTNSTSYRSLLWHAQDSPLSSHIPLSDSPLPTITSPPPPLHVSQPLTPKSKLQT